MKRRRDLRQDPPRNVHVRRTELVACPICAKLVRTLRLYARLPPRATHICGHCKAGARGDHQRTLGQHLLSAGRKSNSGEQVRLPFQNFPDLQRSPPLLRPSGGTLLSRQAELEVAREDCHLRTSLPGQVTRPLSSKYFLEAEPSKYPHPASNQRPASEYRAVAEAQDSSLADSGAQSQEALSRGLKRSGADAVSALQAAQIPAAAHRAGDEEAAKADDTPPNLAHCARLEEDFQQLADTCLEAVEGGKPLQQVGEGVREKSGMSLAALMKSAANRKLPGHFLFKQFVSEEEEQQLVSFIDSCEPAWTLSTFNGPHRGKAWGVRMNLQHRTVLEPTHPMPEVLNDLAARMRELQPLAAFFPNEANANDYRSEEGMFLGPHVDDRQLSTGAIVTLSLVSSAVMSFQRDRQAAGPVIRMELPPRSLQVLTREARYGYTHAIDQTDFHGRRRLSVTFRQSPLRQ